MNPVEPKPINLTALVEKAKGIVFPYSDTYVQSHYEFAKKMWPKKLRRRDEQYIRWKFRGNKAGDIEGFLVAVIDGKVIGQLGLIPVQLKIQDTIHNAQWACDLMVDPTIRKRGIGSLLLAVGMSREMVTLGSDPSTLADVSMSRLGFTPLRGPVKMVFPLKLEPILKWKYGASHSSIISLISKGTQPVWNCRMQLISQSKSSQVKQGSFNDLVTLIAENQKSITQPHIVHDLEFLQWRFNVTGSPLRILLTPDGGYAIYESTTRSFLVYDWHCQGTKDFRELFNQMFLTAYQSQADSILVYANNKQERILLSRFGFFRMRTPTKVIVYPRSVFPSEEDTFHYCIYDSDGNL